MPRGLSSKGQQTGIYNVVSASRKDVIMTTPYHGSMYLGLVAGDGMSLEINMDLYFGDDKKNLKF